MLTPLFFTLITSLAALAISGALGAWLNFGNISTVLLILALSTALGSFFNLRPLWRGLSIVTPAAIFVSVTQDLSAIAPACLALAVITALIHLPTIWTGVPHYPTSRPMYDAVATALPSGKSFSFADLGSGYGSMLFFLAGKFPDAQFSGYEISLLPFALSWLRSLLYRNVKVRFRSFWEISLRDHQVVYAFLAPAPMPKLWAKVTAEMLPSSTFMTNSFPVPAKADQQIPVNDSRRCVLYLHRLR